MEFEIDSAMQGQLEAIRERGRSEARPIGLEADRLGRPIPVDDPYFARLIERGEGRTRWRGVEAEAKARAKKAAKGAKSSCCALIRTTPSCTPTPATTMERPSASS